MSEKSRTCRVISNVMLTPSVFELKFQPDRPVTYKAGQFLSLIIPGAGPAGRDLRRAYSIASPPEANYLELCIKLVKGGPGTGYLSGLNTDDEFRCEAPFGDFVYKTPSDRRVCFIATGTGVAPFRSMMQSQQFKSAPPRETICLVGVREAEELIYLEELQKLSFVNLVPNVTRPRPGYSGHKGRVTDFLRNNSTLFRWEETDFYLCGNGAMIDEAKQILIEKGVQKKSILQEVYYKPKAGEGG